MISSILGPSRRKTAKYSGRQIFFLKLKNIKNNFEEKYIYATSYLDPFKSKKRGQPPSFFFVF
jgi:hypothetical protein